MELFLGSFTLEQIPDSLTFEESPMKGWDAHDTLPNVENLNNSKG